MLSNNEILPNLGYGNIKFGVAMDVFVEKYGGNAGRMWCGTVVLCTNE
jgi:hypothetical protein